MEGGRPECRNTYELPALNSCYCIGSHSDVIRSMHCSYSPFKYPQQISNKRAKVAIAIIWINVLFLSLIPVSGVRMESFLLAYSVTLILLYHQLF